MGILVGMLDGDPDDGIKVEVGVDVGSKALENTSTVQIINSLRKRGRGPVITKGGGSNQLRLM